MVLTFDLFGRKVSFPTLPINFIYLFIFLCKYDLPCAALFFISIYSVILDAICIRRPNGVLLWYYFAYCNYLSVSALHILTSDHSHPRFPAKLIWSLMFPLRFVLCGKLLVQ